MLLPLQRLGVTIAPFLLTLTTATLAAIAINPQLSLAQEVTDSEDKTEVDRLLQQGFQQLYTSQLQDAIAPALPTFSQFLATTEDNSVKEESFIVNGRLDETSDRLGDNNGYYNSHSFEGMIGQLVSIRMVSDEFDTYLIVLDPNGNIIAQNDDSNSENSRIVIELPATGNYTILAISYVAGATGNYTLSLRPASESDIALVEGDRLLQQGRQQTQEGQYQAALQLYEQALAIYRANMDRNGESIILNNIGFVYDGLGQSSQSLFYYEQVLPFFRELGDRFGEGVTLNNIGRIYRRLGQYSQALNYYAQALPIFREFSDRRSEGVLLNNIGAVYQRLGQYSQALEYFHQALVIRREVNDRAGESGTLNNAGLVYARLKQYLQALDHFQQALIIARELGNRRLEGEFLNNIGTIHQNLDQHLQALDHFRQALVFRREVDDRTGEGVTLNNIGTVYEDLGQYSQAFDHYQQALIILREVGDRETEGITLHNIGMLLAQQNQPELAVVFFKQSVNIREQIRDDIRELSQEQQESYTETVANTYRELADLLLSQGRILEAQQVLELLKVEELREFTRGAVLDSGTEEIQYTAAEEEVLRIHGSLTELGYLLEQCGQTIPACEERETLRNQRIALTSEYNDAIARLQSQVRNRFSEDAVALNPEYFAGEAGELLRDKPNTILIYPVVLEDKLWVLWGTSSGIVNSIEVEDVNQQQLGEAVLRFRQLMEACEVSRCNSSDIPDIQAVAQEIYGYLIPPQLETEFEQIERLAAENNQVPNLVFSLDRITRYIPMAALFDGDRYLIERFTVSTILSAGQTRTNNPLPQGTDNTSVLALGLSEAVPAIPDENIPEFRALNYVPAEIGAIVRQSPTASQGVYPGQLLLNQEFDLSAFEQLENYHILHIATHGEFIPVQHGLSYLVLGTKQPLRIRQIEDMQQDFSHLSLVVLSACETALGDTGQDGIEINGIAHSIIKAGANTVVASLWLVNDPATSALMQQFYGTLAQGTVELPVTISQSLRQAQLSLLNGGADSVDDSMRGEIGGGTGTVTSRPTSNSRSASRSNVDYSHPYYWAPFILIGNGL